MSYTLLHGQFVIRYADLPRQGPEPDGDTVKFLPASPALVGTLPRPSGRPPAIGARGISVRLEAIDALETHFAETHQALEGAGKARDALLAALGFTHVTFFVDMPNKVESTDQDSMPGWVLSNGIDANGRLIGFVFAGTPPAPDGSRVFVDETMVDSSVNAQLLTSGLVYPTFYGTLPATLRLHLSGISRAARSAGLGLWPVSAADPDGAVVVQDGLALESLTLWPKLFRRLVPYFAAGYTSLDGFDAWLRQDPVNRDDKVLLLDPTEPGNLHDVIVAAGQQVQMTRWPEDFIIEPDPAPSGSTTKPEGYAGGDIAILALLPDPKGSDSKRETVTILNTTDNDISIDNWNVVDGSNRREPLAGSLASGDVRRLVLTGRASLGNTGGSVTLIDPSGAVIDRVTYTESQVRAGRTIVIAR